MISPTNTQKIKSLIQDHNHTTEKVVKALNSLMYFLRFIGKDQTDYNNKRLPTLYTEIWTENGLVRYALYEKLTV